MIARERHGDYLGATIQVIPHITDAIKEFIGADLDGEDFVPVRDRRHRRRHREPAVPGGHPPARQRARPRPGDLHPRHPGAVSAGGERAEDQADAALGEGAARASASSRTCCCAAPTGRSRTASASKIALFCNVRCEAVIPALDVDTIYAVPISYHEQGLDDAGLPPLRPATRRHPTSTAGATSSPA